MAGQRSTLRVLCFGDSLTAGYARHGAVYHPYCEKMAQMVSMALPHVAIDAVEDGKPGDMVLRGFYDRLQRQFKRSAKPFDWTIVLGGTNDLAYANNDPEAIYKELCRVWDVALTNKSKVLALTVPESGTTGFRGHADERRNKLNSLIRDHKAEGFYVCDLHAVLPYYSMTAADRERYWDDTVHLTPDGYDLLGNKVGMRLVSTLIKEKACPTPRQRKMRKDDHSLFVEEDGDPKRLDQGYIVVRWKDLD